MKREKFNITGMHCTNCSLNITKNIEKLEGIEKVNINLITSKMSVIYDEKIIDVEKIIEIVEKIGYGIEKINNKKNKENIEEIKKDYYIIKLVISIILTVLIMYLSMGHMLGFNKVNNSEIIQIIISISIMYLYKEYYFSGFLALKNNSSNMSSLIAVSTLASFVYSIFNVIKGENNDLYFESIAVILTLVSIGKYIERRIKKNATKSITKMINLTPKKATIIKDGNEIVIDVGDLEIDDEVLIKTGEIISCDGIILEGKAYVNESSITGESKLIEKNVNDEVIASSILEKGYLKVRVNKEANDTIIAKIIELVEEATSSKAPISKLADKISGILVPIIFVFSILTFIFWLVIGNEFSEAINRAISVLVISCPCALGIATPISIMIGNLKGSQMGILFKRAELLEIIKKANIILMDKTGTITKGEPKVIDFISISDDDRVIKYIYSAEKKSEHHLATSVVTYCENLGINTVDIDEFIQVEGRGINAKIKNNELLIGNEKMMLEYNIDLSKYIDDINRYSKQGKTVILASINGSLVAIITIADEIREDVKITIEKLKNKNIRPIMLTGDNIETARYVAKLVGIEEVYAGLLPNEKYDILINLQENNKVIMVGDGINDAPALAKADVGISIGGSTDIAMEISDIVLMKQRLIDIINAINLSKAVIINIKFSLFWAFIYNIMGITLAMGLFVKFGLTLNPMFAAFAMSLSSMCILLNAMTLKLFKGENK
ncbi:copper-translocating P-type ATPase [Streptobacillus moniliformis]|uniref:Heavy metal translocating P-type ATPase n=1 Tax=Streptobacillus moniliformis (strain ATCC 14647 / DSM 12112 / NCTC 10651 / 9901) TaxID=519441 RepID=D1AY95_STRM9|nr:heavy metal translocating P-type ATPase [Streptobacillus moniliformis]ACZ01271.1 heavy metal translocating P-type ATPase [Streptobacillus moniliformis DSM 12112]AVL42372.1 copper-translocating P-type ATPase [Streptobacillus moniliformis]SQA13572.1 Copper-exporting P-type ATPase A [Streptobacillus moniliformis]